MQTIMEKIFNVKENDTKVNSIEVRLNYRRDEGYSYWDGHRQERGYILSMTPTTRSEHNGYISSSHIIGSGGYIMLRKVKRKSVKVERELLEKLTDEKLKEIVNKYLPEYEIEQ